MDTKLSKIFENKFPVNPVTKKPLTDNGFKDATTNPEIIENWRKRFPNCGWGIPTGNGLFVVDVDKKTGGIENWNKLVKEFGEVNTYTVKTRNDGLHLYFLTSGIVIKNSVGKVAKGIDVRGNGGYVVIPPTPGYQVIKDIELASPPIWLLNLILRKEFHKPYSEPPIIKEGKRNDTLFRLASSLRARGMSDEAILSALLAENKNRCVPPLEDEEVEIISISASRYEQGGIIEKYNLTDLGNAKRFVELHKDKARYCTSEKTWYIWNGKKWKEDRLGNIYLLAEEVIKLLHQEAIRATDSEERKQIAQHAYGSEAGYAIKQMVSLAENYLAIEPQAFDKDLELVNVNNGIVNLRTKELIPHSPDYFMRKIVDFDYHPDSDCPKWKEFINFILNKDYDTILWIQKVLGLSISGKTDRVLPFLYGLGGNGKSVFSETLLRIFGEYGQKTNLDALSIGGFHEVGDKPNSVVAKLKGARFVIANETRQDVKLNASLMKDLTGGDTINVRDLHEKTTTFHPTHTLWIYGNHKPVIEDTTDSIWDRICEVEFKVKIPDEKKKMSNDVISEFLEEGNGILKWIIDGYSLMLKEGLNKTKAIELSTNEFRDEEDVFRQFIDEECELGIGFEIPKDSLISAFSSYCMKYGERKSTLSKSKITRRVKEIGISDGGNNKRLYLGIRLQNNKVTVVENKEIQDNVDSILNGTVEYTSTISGF